MQKRNVLNSPRLLELKNSRRKELQTKIFVSFFAVVIIIGFLAYISHLSILNISEINISGNNVIETSDIQSVAQKDISGKYFWLFPKSNILFYPASRIKSDIITNFPRLQNINLSVKKDKILSISVAERSPKYTWCGGVLSDPTIQTTEKCYFMDDKGYIFDDAPYFSGDIYFKFYGNINNVSNNPKGNYFAPEIFNKLMQLKETLVSMNLKPKSLNLKDSGDIEIYLSAPSVASSLSPKIILNKDQDFKNVAENLDSALSTDPLQTDFKNKYNSLMYIDLRYGNKVYYKFK